MIIHDRILLDDVNSLCAVESILEVFRVPLRRVDRARRTPVVAEQVTVEL